MVTPVDIFEAVRDFLEAGGLVVQILMGVAAFLWALILERELYYRLANSRGKSNRQQAKRNVEP